MYITFTHQKYLFLLLVIPFFILIHVLSLRSTRRKALSFANFEAISRIKGIELFSKNITTLFLSVVIIFLLIFSISGLTLHTQATASSFSFVLAIDSSRSMEAKDMNPSRIEVAKQVAKEFVDASPATTRIGVVSFSGNSYINQDITENKDLVKDAINGIEISLIEGTDIYEVLITSTNLLKNEESRAIILLSDGQLNVGELDKAVQYANDNDVFIHTIVVGTKEGGKTTFGVSKVDEDALKALSYNTEGEFFNATNKATLSDSFNKALKLTKKKVSVELAPYLLLTSLVLFLVEYFLINMKYRIFP